MPNKVSVIIPNWNNRDLLALCLVSLKAQLHPASEIIVVDNGSTDGAPEMVKERFADVRLIMFSENKGFSAAVNEGIRAASGGLIALINNDAEADPRWLLELTAAADRHPNAGSFASKMLFHSDRTTIDTFGDGFTSAGFGYKRGWGEHSGSYAEEGEVLGACGGAAMYRRGMLEDVKVAGEYFDEDFFAFGEDLDLSLRARLYGHGCVAVPGAVVYHRVRATAGRGSELSLFLSHRNFTLAVLKNFPTGVILGGIVSLICYPILAAAADFIKNRRFLYLKSCLAAFGMWARMKPKRAAVQAGARITPSAFRESLTKGWLSLWLKLNRMSRSVSARGL